MKYNKGFTLIELLVVIAIIGILSSVVLASLNTARSKGADAAIKSNLANMRAQAAIYYDSSNTYAGVCTDDVVLEGITAAVETAGDTYAEGTNCASDAENWAAYSDLKNPDGSTTGWCVDSEGTSKASTGISGNLCQ